MATLTALLQSNPIDISKALRQAFRPTTAPIDITDEATKALIILVNLTEAVKKQTNLLDPASCKQKLRDDKWWQLCLSTMQYRNSHNPKFPDIRATGVIRAIPQGELAPFMLSSSKLPQECWTYANNSEHINKSLFLTSEFIWDNHVRYLGEILSDEKHILWQRLCELGCYLKTKKLIIKTLSQIPPLEIAVKLAPNYLTQISLPNGDGSYVSLSPVASQSMQGLCYRALDSHLSFSRTTHFSRTTNLGHLATSCAGKFRMICTVPPIHRYKHHYLMGEEQWLTQSSFRAMREYLASSQWLMPENKLKQKKQSIKKVIDEMLTQWLSIQTIDDSSTAKTFTEMFNAELAKTKFASRYAYEPLLTQLILSSMTKQLITPARFDTNKSELSKNTYILLPNLRVSGASAMNSPISIGLPSMMAFFGFTHAFERNIQSIIPNFSNDSFAVCIHSLHLDKRGLTREPVLNTKNSISAPAMRDDWQCDLELSIILKCSDYTELNLHDLIRHIPKRLARGHVALKIKDFHQEAHSDLASVIKAIPTKTGRWLSLNHEVCIDNFEDILCELSENKMQSVNCIGYHLLEVPCEKRYSLRGYQHAFAEGILGLLKFIPINNVTDPKQYFWRYQYREHGPVLLPRGIE